MPEQREKAPKSLMPETPRAIAPKETEREREAEQERYELEARQGDARLEARPAVRAQSSTSTQTTSGTKDGVLDGVEDILSDGLAGLYATFPEDRKKKFKEKGEEVALKIRAMIIDGKVRVHRFLQLIREWLRMIPGVNKFFLEQEAKIKADRLLAFAEDFRNRPAL